MTHGIRVGLGFDAHRFAEERPLILGGVRFREHDGLLGHSDADVVAHAVMDALLGAGGFEDIGHYFPDRDARFEGADSMELLATVAEMLRGARWRVVNIDCVVICEEPKIAPRRSEMRAHIAEALGTEAVNVMVRGTTTEGMGFLGRRDGIAAQAVALVERTQDDERETDE